MTEPNHLNFSSYPVQAKNPLHFFFFYQFNNNQNLLSDPGFGGYNFRQKEKPCAFKRLVQYLVLCDLFSEAGRNKLFLKLKVLSIFSYAVKEKKSGYI